MNLLLDTHVVLWALYEPEKLPRTVVELVTDRSNNLFVSHASILEIVNKAAAGRLALIGPSTERFMEHLRNLGVTFLPISLQDILSASALPGHHRDPIDRILIAQAQANNLRLATGDAAIHRYDVNFIWR